MSRTNTKPTIAKALYLSGHKPEKIAALIGVTLRTVQGYKAKAMKSGDNWEQQKIVKYLDNAQKDSSSLYADFVEHMYDELRQIKQNTKLKTKERIDAIARLGDSFSKMRRIAAVENPEAYAHGIVKSTIEKMIVIIKPAVDKECLSTIIEEIEAHQKELADVAL